MKLRALLTITTITLTLATVGCTGGKFNLLKSVETAGHLKLLDAEFDRAVDAIAATPLNEAERTVIDDSIAVLDSNRQFLRELHKQSAGRQVMTAVQAQQRKDEMTIAYVKGHKTYLEFKTRTKAPDNQMLIAFDNSARTAAINIQEGIDSGAGISGPQMAQYLGLALRAIAAINGVPIVDSQDRGSALLADNARLRDEYRQSYAKFQALHRKYRPIVVEPGQHLL